MSNIRINDKSFSNISGNNIFVIDGKVYVDNKLITDESNSKQIKVTIEGDINNLKVINGDVEINGNVKGRIDAGGSVKCNDVGKGGVDCGGSVTCNNINGDVDCGGSIRCENITGNIDAGGSVKYYE